MCRFANFRLDVLELKALWVLELTYSILVVERLMAMAMEEKMFNSLKEKLKCVVFGIVVTLCGKVLGQVECCELFLDIT